MDKRAQKRWKRENRKNKGVSAEAKRQEYNARVRTAQRDIGSFATGADEAMMLLAAGMMGKKR